MGKFKQDYVGDSPYIDYTSNAAQITDMGIARIPCTITNDSYTLNMAYKEVVKLMENNLCVAYFSDGVHGQNDLIMYYNGESFTVYMASGAELVAADVDSYPTNAE